MLAPVIVDCDPGPDDAANLLLAANSFGARLTHIVTSYGCGSISNSTSNAAGFADALDIETRILRGADAPGSGHPLTMAGEALPTFFGSNGFNDLVLSPSTREIAGAFDSRELYDALKPGNVTYFLTGPCTNLARLIHLDPEFVREKIRAIYIMGGALDSPGNAGRIDLSTGMAVAEYNFYLDATAADTVLKSGIPIRLSTWDEAQRICLPKSTIDALTSKHPAGEILIQTMLAFFKLYHNNNVTEESSKEPTLALCDPLTVLTALGYGNYDTVRVKVITEGEDYGRLVRCPDGSPVEYCRLSDPQQALAFFVNQLQKSGR